MLHLRRNTVLILTGLALLLGFTTAISAPYTEITGDVRVQVLSPTLVRLETRGPAGFEDRKTFHITNRNWSGTSVTRTETNSVITLSTADFKISVPTDASFLDGITIKKPDETVLWEATDVKGQYFYILNRWRDYYLYDDAGVVRYDSVPDTDAHLWTYEYSGGYTQIKNKASGNYLNIENLQDWPECTAVDPSWHSKDWILENGSGNYRRLKCRWQDQYLHVENQVGYPQFDSGSTTNSSGSAVTNWFSSEWEIGGNDRNRVWLPHPKEETWAFEINDFPRIVPADHGYNYPGSDLPDNGWDLSNPADDIYIFLPKGDGFQLRQDFIDLTGHSGMVPLHALGLWDSRWHPYTDSEALTKIDTYRFKNIPLDVMVIDTQWRIGDIGYNVNTSYFPNMAGFLDQAHQKNVKIMFNDHPEAQTDYALDPVEVYYRNYEGLKTIFGLGLDIWWYDRNWPIQLTCPESLNIETWGMYVYHSITKGYYPDKRPLIMANADGLDNYYTDLLAQRPPNMASHRYSIHWTGDTLVGWDTLKREVHAMLRYGLYEPMAYISTDVGGFKNTPSRDLYIRNVQYGALSPIMRLHCSINSDGREPWKFEAPAEEVARNFIQMRYRLMPVFYAAARKNYDTGEPICRRLDLDYPAYTEAERSDQYLIGDNILVAPIVDTNAQRTVWIPPGTWTDVFTGQKTSGPTTVAVSPNIYKIPLYVKNGAVIPLAPNMQYTTEKPWNNITLDLYPEPGVTGQTTLYEDENDGNAYKTGGYRTTAIQAETDAASSNITVTIAAADGTFSNALSNRAWKIRFRNPTGWNESAISSVMLNESTPLTFNSVSSDANGIPFSNSGGAPDADLIEISVPTNSVASQQVITIQYGTGSGAAVNLIQNPSFETGGATPDSWTIVSSVGTTENAQDGAYSLKLDALSQSALQTIPIETGTTYNISVWIDASQMTNGIAVFDTADKYDDSGEGQFVMYTANSGWTKYSGSFTATNTSLTLRIFTSGSFGGTVYYDNISLTEQDNASGYDTWATANGITGGQLDDDNLDGLDNLTEYAISEKPVVTKSGSSFEYIYKQRTDDPALGYTLETCSDLVSGSWTNTGYTILGTNITGGTYSDVTNSIPTDNPQSYIRLKISYD